MGVFFIFVPLFSNVSTDLVQSNMLDCWCLVCISEMQQIVLQHNLLLPAVVRDIICSRPYLVLPGYCCTVLYVCHLSVRLSSVTLCTVAKQCFVGGW